MVKQYKVRVEVDLVISVDDDCDVEDVLSDMDYDFEVAEDDDNAEIVLTEIIGWKVTNTRNDTILI